MPHISQKLGQFRYFDIQLGHPYWQGKHVLDFGGNNGNFLKESSVDPAKYWCIDVCQEAVEAGKREFPQAHWIWYNRYNISFNPQGSHAVTIPSLTQSFDYILAYSVFTHTDMSEMHQFVKALLSFLKPGAMLAFTFIDPFYRSSHNGYPGTNLEWRLMKSNLLSAWPETDVLFKKVEGARWFRLTGDAAIFRDDESVPLLARYEGQPYHVFHTAEFIREQFPGCRILAPVNHEVQHCCLLRS